MTQTFHHTFTTGAKISITVRKTKGVISITANRKVSNSEEAEYLKWRTVVCEQIVSQLSPEEMLSLLP